MASWGPTSPTEAVMRLDEEVIDQNGVARFGVEDPAMVNDDSTIAPWIDVPPTPPPKSPLPIKTGSSSRSLGFSTKSSFASFVSGSGSSLLRSARPSASESQSALSVPDYKRRSTDDAEPSIRGGVSHSSASTNSGETKRSKGSGFIQKLRLKASKSHLRNDSDEQDPILYPYASHPSLQPPVPPLPSSTAKTVISYNQYNPASFDGAQPPPPPTISLPPSGKKDKRDKESKGRKKSSAAKIPPAVPPKEGNDVLLSLDAFTTTADRAIVGITGFDKDQMAGIVDFDTPQTYGPPGSIINGLSTSPISSSGIDSSISHSDYDLSDASGHGVAFGNPWQSSPAERRKMSIPRQHNGSDSTIMDARKVSPKSIPPYHAVIPNVSANASTTTLATLSSGSGVPLPPLPMANLSTSPDLHGQAAPSPTTLSQGHGSEKWVPPESWEIVNPADAYDTSSRSSTSKGGADGHSSDEYDGLQEDDDGITLVGPGGKVLDTHKGFDERSLKNGLASGNMSLLSSNASRLSVVSSNTPSSRRRHPSHPSASSFSSHHLPLPYGASQISLSSTHPPITRSTHLIRRGSSPFVRLPFVRPLSTSHYQIRIYRQSGEYHVVSITTNSTVGDFIEKIKSRLGVKEKRGVFCLYLKEQGRERMLNMQESPASIVRLRQEQAGYDYEDGVHLLSNENLNMLLKFVFKSQAIAGGEQIQFDNYDFVDLSGRGLRTIPISLHQNAHDIISLRLSRNPMIEIPLDFIQSCTLLRELRLSNMAMKRVPQSLRHSSTLHRLDLSCNSIKDLEDAGLDHIQGLMTLFVQNNRLEKLPWYFPRLRNLITLNISNNKFKEFPEVLTRMETLRDLDISFNMITELPDDIGKLRTLERFILVGNQVSRFSDEFANLVNLRVLDCRRNRIGDLGIVCTLPVLSNLSADHNVVKVLEVKLGDHLTTLDVSHNDITVLKFVEDPNRAIGASYALTSLDLSYARLASLDGLALSQLSNLRTLKMDHNSIRTIPESLGELKWLETLSVTDNKLEALPASIGNLQKLEILDAHNNSLSELPQSMWNCASLTKINVTSNFISMWHDPPVQPPDLSLGDSPILEPRVYERKPSTASSLGATGPIRIPSLVHSLERLYLGENNMKDDSLYPLMIFKELRVLNLSFNEIQDLPSNFFHNLTELVEIYLSGNKLTTIPSEDLGKLKKLTTLYLNANRLHTIPQELKGVTNLNILDVGSNALRYNINNTDFDWNWNFNTNLRYLNLSGNKRLQIKTEKGAGGGDRRSMQSNLTLVPSNPAFLPVNHANGQPLSGFTALSNLRVLGLMDVTITSTAKDAAIDIPDETADRRVRTSLSTVCGMGYGIADSMGKNDHLTMLDLVHEFADRDNEAIFAMFGRTVPPKHMKPGSQPNKLAKFLHDNFPRVFEQQVAAVNERQRNEGIPIHQWKDGIPKALHWTFLKLNQDLFSQVNMTQRKGSHASTGTTHAYDSQSAKIGVSGIALYFKDKTIYAANAGDALAVVSRQGVCVEISRKHDPYDRSEAMRIRAAEGFISPPGLVNDEVDVSRSFGYFNLFPTLNAKPDLFLYELTDLDEFVIIANRGLWDYVPYQTAVDIARTVARQDNPDAMLAAQKLRDFAISYGAEGSTMIMVVWVADLVGSSVPRSRQPTLDSIVDPQKYKARRKDEVRDRIINRLMGEVPAPIGHVTLVFTDIRNSTVLWESKQGMPAAMTLHNTLLRRQLRFCGGYEVKTEGDAFMCSFPTSLAAVWFCLTVQLQLLHEPWPLDILQSDDGRPVHDENGVLVARGLSVRMGIHSGYPLCETDVITHRMDYFGPMVNRSARINGCAKGGQIMVSNDIIREIKASVLKEEEPTDYSKLQTPAAIDAIRRLGVIIVSVGEVKLKGIELPEVLSAIYPRGLETRHDLKEEPDPEPEPDTLEGQLAPIARSLGTTCLSVETISTGRFFRACVGRKNSMQSTTDNEDTNLSLFYGDPEQLLPSFGDNLSADEFISILDSLITRIENAVEATSAYYNISPSQTGPKSATALLKALEADGVLDQDAMEYIASVLGRL